MHRISWSVAIVTALWLTATAAAAPAPDASPPAAPPLASVTSLPVPAEVLTAKERLGAKWMDEQRVDNCKVPIDKRGPKPLPEACSTTPTE